MFSELSQRTLSPLCYTARPLYRLGFLFIEQFVFTFCHTYRILYWAGIIFLCKSFINNLFQLFRTVLGEVSRADYSCWGKIYLSQHACSRYKLICDIMCYFSGEWPFLYLTGVHSSMSCNHQQLCAHQILFRSRVPAFCPGNFMLVFLSF